MNAQWMFRERLFETCVGASAGFHVLVWTLAWVLTHRPAAAMPVPVMEVDIRTPFLPRSPDDKRLPGAAKGIPAYAPRRTIGGPGPQPPQAKPNPVPVIAPPATPEPKEKPWVLPGPETRKIEKPTLGELATPPGTVGADPTGTGPGGENGTKGGMGWGTGTGPPIVDRPPRLVNKTEILGMIRRAYPELERRMNHEGSVVLEVEIGADGLVKNVKVAQSAGADFDEAAESVARKMVFEPRLVKSVPTATKVRQPIVFQLGN